MKRWVKGFLITGVVLLCAGAGMTAVAGVMSHGRFGTRDGIDRTRQFYDEYLREILPFHWGEKFEKVADKVTDGLTFGEDDWPEQWDWWGDQDYTAADMDGMIQEIGQQLDDRINLPSMDQMKLTASFDKVKSLELKALGGIVMVEENADLDHQINIYIEKRPKRDVTAHCEEDSPGEISIEFQVKGYQAHDDQVIGLVEIPVGYRFDSAKLKSKGGVIKADRILAGSLSMDAEGGVISAKDMAADSLKAEVEGGAMVVSGKVDNRVETDVKAGAVSLTLDGHKEDYTYEIDNIAGSVRVDGASPSALYQIRGAKKMELDCTAGGLDIKFR